MVARRSWLALAPVAAFLVNLLPLASFFNSDDFGLLAAVRSSGPFGIWSGNGQPFFRPIVSASVWVDSQIWGLEPFGFHLTNVILHSLNAFLVSVFVSQLLRRLKLDLPYVPIFAGLLFALLPCHAEAVAWVSGRTDLLATTFALGCCVSFLSRSKWRVPVAGGLFLLSLLSKESALLLPVFLLLFVLTTREVLKERKADLLTAASGFGIVGVYLGLRVVIIGQLFGGYGESSYFGVGLSGLAKNSAVYAGKALSPGSMQMLKLSGLPVDERGPAVLAALVVLIGGLGAFFAVRDRSTNARLVLMGVVGFFLLALPALPLGMNPYTSEGSRFLYLPSLGICLALSVLMGSIPKLWLSCLIAAGVGGAYASALWMQNSVWHEAGEDARRSIQALRDIPARTPLLGAPDSYRGAYVLRNGMSQALDLFGGHKPTPPLLSLYSYEFQDQVPDVRSNKNLVELRAAGNYGSLLTPGPDAKVGSPESPVAAFAPSRMILRAPNGLLLTPNGLVVPSLLESFP